MKTVLRSLCRPLGALLLLTCLPVTAATVYKSVDTDGVVSFSDTQPTDSSQVEMLEIEVTEPQLSATDEQRLEELRDTTDRMAADRREREQHRAEMREQQAAAQTQIVEVESGYDGYSSSYSSGRSGYYPYPVRRPGWRPRPTHPIARPPGHRPPMRPPGGIHPRPLPAKPIIDYPASLVRKSYSPQVRAAFER